MSLEESKRDDFHHYESVTTARMFNTAIEKNIDDSTYPMLAPAKDSVILFGN